MNSAPIPGMKIVPYGCPMMTDAFLGCVHWAVGEEHIKQAFKAETGLDLDSLVTASPLARQIDETTGRTSDMMAAFCDFVAENVWGTEGSA